MITRDVIISKLEEALSGDDNVLAFWQGGSAAHNRIDALSDIDAYLLVRDGAVEESYRVVEQALASLAPIDRKWSTRRGVCLDVYHLENTVPTLTIDCVVIEESKALDLEQARHGTPLVIFDKTGRIKPEETNWAKERKVAREELLDLMSKFALAQPKITKAIDRNMPLDAFALYRFFTLDPLLFV